MNERQRNVIVGIDVGTTKICTIVGKYDCDAIGSGHLGGGAPTSLSTSSHPKLRIIGIGNVPSLGLKKGMVVNLDKTIFSIKNSIREAKKATKIEIDEAYISVAGIHIGSFNNQAEIMIRNSSGIITLRDVERAIEEVKNVVIPEDRKILHVIPQEFRVDGISGIKNPVGMCGTKLEISSHIITGTISALQNLNKCVENAGVKVKNFILQPLASSVASLSEEEKNLGVVLLDIGGGTSDLAIWKRGALIYSQSIPIGGNHFTNDLAVALNTAYGEAEKIKLNYGNVLFDRINLDRMNRSAHVSVYGLNGSNDRCREIPIHYVSKVLCASSEELFRVINRIIDEKNLRKDLIVGMVLTGGGARIRGLNLLAEPIVNMPVKIGNPLHLKEAEGIIQLPEFSTAVGLLMVAYRQEVERNNRLEKNNFDIVYKLNRSLRSIFKEIF
ncbi:MAG: cell division protein FtsA [Oligoflexia bacterium]|nr:cell division protein FtsA [Oligoflexia bacterium]